METERAVHLEDLGLDAPDRYEYRPSPWRELRRVLPPSDVGTQDVFIDFGSGMGRAVLLAAAQYPIKRAIGVEIAAELNAIATRNLERARDRLVCQDVQFVTADVLEYEMPDDVTIVYFYNPFTGPIFGHAVRSVLDSLDRRPRRLRVVYRHPLEHDQLMATGRARLVRAYRPSSWRRCRTGAPTHVYELAPGS